jgi:hypothetical protein
VEQIMREAAEWGWNMATRLRIANHHQQKGTQP